MKQTLLSTLLALGLSVAGSHEVQAQTQVQETYKQWNVFTNPFGYFLGSFNVGAGYAFNKHFAASLTASYLNAYYIDPKITGFDGRVALAGYFQNVWEGFYIEPGFTYARAKQDALGGDITVNLIMIDTIAGWAWQWDSGFNATIGIGAGYWAGGEDLDTGDVNTTADFDGPTMTGKLAFGYAF